LNTFKNNPQRYNEISDFGFQINYELRITNYEVVNMVIEMVVETGHALSPWCYMRYIKIAQTIDNHGII